MVFNTDKEGFIINDGSLDKIQGKLKPILEEIVNFSKEILGDNFLSAYIRGSVSVGNFIDNISDIDFIVVAKEEPNQKNVSDFLNYSLALDDKYSWVKGFDLFLVSKYKLLNSSDLNKLRVYLSTQSVLLDGTDLSIDLIRYKPDRELSKVLLSEIDQEFLFLHNIFSSEKQNFSYNNQIRPLKFWCIWMSRVVLRFALYASLEKHHSYTNDLRDCYSIVSKIYPELEPELFLALKWSQLPIDDGAVLKDYFEKISFKIKNIFLINNK